MTAIATVIIPCAPHHQHLLPRAIDSARKQSIPVDVLTYIDTERRGPGYGRNVLAAQVKTPFLIQLDADDWLLPHFVATHLLYWRRGSYTYSDWLEAGQHVQAVDCYGLTGARPPYQRSFHLPPTLFPTALYHAIGGYDEALFGAEDTDFFFKANALGIRSIRIPEPLFVYTDDGRRAKETAANARWKELILEIFGRYKGRMSMACCGDINPVAPNPGAKQEGDVWVRARWGGRSRTVGVVSGRDYGRIAFPWTGWIDPRDVAAQAHLWEVIPEAVALSPTEEEVAKAQAQTVETAPEDTTSLRRLIDYNFAGMGWDDLDRAIHRFGLHDFDRGEGIGYDMQQHSEELADFLLAMRDLGIQRVLEIGTGAGGLARFMAMICGWQVTSIDPVEPGVWKEVKDNLDYPAPGRWDYIQASSQDVVLPEDAAFDLILIDGDHSYEGAKADWEKFSPLARVVAAHDISPRGFFHDDVARFWREVAYTPKGKLRSGFHEAIRGPVNADGKELGWGWHVRD